MGKTKKPQLFVVSWHVDATGYCFVVADSPEAARQVAEDEFCPSDSNTELGDPIDIVSINPIKKSNYSYKKTMEETLCQDGYTEDDLEDE